MDWVVVVAAASSLFLFTDTLAMMSWVSGHAVSIIQSQKKNFSFVYTITVTNQLRKLFLNGPSSGQFGFWSGMKHEQICGRITNHAETFWVNHQMECSDMIEDRFQAFTQTFETLLYFYILFSCAQLFWRHFLDVGLLLVTGRGTRAASQRVMFCVPDSDASSHRNMHMIMDE